MPFWWLFWRFWSYWDWIDINYDTVSFDQSCFRMNYFFCVINRSRDPKVLNNGAFCWTKDPRSPKRWKSAIVADTNRIGTVKDVYRVFCGYITKTLSSLSTPNFMFKVAILSFNKKKHFVSMCVSKGESPARARSWATVTSYIDENHEKIIKRYKLKARKQQEIEQATGVAKKWNGKMDAWLLYNSPWNCRKCHDCFVFSNESTKM